MPYIIDYKEEVKRLLTDLYEPADIISKEFRYTTKQILQYLQQVLPENSVDEHLVYETLLELDYSPKEEKPLQYFWYFKRKIG